MDTGSVTIAANGQKKFQAGPANYLHVYEAQGLMQVTLFKNRSQVESHSIARLTTLNNREFDEFILQDLSGSNNTVRIFTGPGPYEPSDRAQVTIDDSTPISVEVEDATPVRVDLVTGSVTVNEAQPNDIVPLDDVTVGAAAGVLVTARANSLTIVLSIKDTEANGIRYGDSTVTATKGAYLGPGQQVALDLANHAIYAIRDGAANVSVSITALDRV